MHTLDFLNTRELKEIDVYLEKQWGVSLPREYAYIMRKNGDVFMVGRDIERIGLSKLSINSLGLYIGEYRSGEFRPGIEGSQLFGPKAGKNVVNIEKEQLRKWFAGEEIESSEAASGYVILKSGNDYVGCGRMIEGKISNFVPKTRRVRIF